MAEFDVSTLVFNERGLIPAVAQDQATGAVLMLAWMNAESIDQTLASGQVTYFSRSRQQLWRKGATSGHVQHLIEMRVDCDSDSLLLIVDQTGPACHTGAKSCFFKVIRNGVEVSL